MAKVLTEADIKSALKLATSATKGLVIAGVNGNKDFPELLADYTWTGTRDYNMALIIVAFYAYCAKSENPELKKFGLSALRDGSLSNKMFETLREGNGKKVKDCMKMPFMIALDTVLQTALLDDKDKGIDNKDKRAKIIKSFINQAGKITPWIINGKDISDVIDRLIGSAAEANKDMIQTEENKKNQLLNAVKSSDLKTVQEIIESNPHLVNSSIDSSGNTPLYYAAENGHTEIVKHLLEKGANPSIQDKYRNAPLHYAVIKAHTEIVKLLLEKGANPNIQNQHGYTSLQYAALYGYTEIVKLLLDKGADLNKNNSMAKTPLYYAAENGHTETVKLLLNKGAKLNIQDKYGVTPLHYATENGHTEIVKLLLEKGANPNIEDKNGGTPLHLAELHKNEEIIRLLSNRSKEITERKTKK